jgi:hypothetical protein
MLFFKKYEPIIGQLRSPVHKRQCIEIKDGECVCDAPAADVYSKKITMHLQIYIFFQIKKDAGKNEDFS